MNNKKLLIGEIVGCIFCLAMSFVFHFAYEWLGKTIYLAWLFPINESVWEHSKLIFYPFLIYSIIEYFILKPNAKVFVNAKCIMLSIIVPLMIIAYYTYSGILGSNNLVIDILISVVIIIVAFAIGYKMIDYEYLSKHFLFYLMLAILTLIFIIIFTYIPPKIALFFDSVNGKYGV